MAATIPGGVQTHLTDDSTVSQAVSDAINNLVQHSSSATLLSSASAIGSSTGTNVYDLNPSWDQVSQNPTIQLQDNGPNSTNVLVYNSTHYGTLVGNTGSEMIVGNDAHDTIYAAGGHGSIYAGDADDVVYLNSQGTVTGAGGSGDMLVSLGAGRDSIYMDGSNATVTHTGVMTNYQTGFDYIYVQGGSNNLTLGAGDDTVSVTGGSVTLLGGSGALYYNGTAGAGGDSVTAGTGSSTLVAGANDTLIGSSSSTAQTVFVAGHGNESMVAGAGADTFSFTTVQAAGGHFTISGFDTTTDKINLTKGYSSVYAMHHETTVAGGVQLSLDANTTITILGVSSVGADSFTNSSVPSSHV